MPAAGFGGALAQPADNTTAHRPAATAARGRVAIHPPIGCIVQHPRRALDTCRWYFIPGCLLGTGRERGLTGGCLVVIVRLSSQRRSRDQEKLGLLLNS